MAQAAFCKLAPPSSHVAEDMVELKHGALDEYYSASYARKSNYAQVTAPLQFIGGRGGSQHVVRGWQEGKLVTKLRIYSGYWQIKAVRMWLSGDGDNEYKEFGNPAGSGWAEFAFQDGERVTRMSLWGNGAGTRAGWIYFETNKGRSFDCGMHGWPKKTEYRVDVGSGILVGAIYNAGADIDAHGYYFLASSITSAQATDVSYPTLQFDSHQITPINLDSYRQTNSSGSPRSWEFHGGQQVKQSQKWTLQIGNTFSVSLTFKAAAPTVVEVGGQFGWQLSVVSTHEAAQESTHSLNWKTGGTLQPGESVHLVALTRKGKLSVPYKSTVVVTLKNGATFTFPSSGTYEGLGYTGVELTDAPTAARLNAKPRSYLTL